MVDKPQPPGRPALHVVPKNDGATPDDTERGTLPDGPATDRLDVPDELKHAITPAKRGEKHDLFSVTTFKADTTLIRLFEPITTAYAILSGEACEYALDEEGKLVTNEPLRIMGPGSLVNSGLFSESEEAAQSKVEVRSKTDLVVYLITLEDLAAYDVEREQREAVRHRRELFIRRGMAHESDPNLSGRTRLFERMVSAMRGKKEAEAIARVVTHEAVSEASIIAYAELQRRYRELVASREHDQVELQAVRQQLIDKAAELNAFLSKQIELDDLDQLRREKPDLFNSRLMLIFYSLLPAEDDIELQMLATRGVSLLMGRAKPGSNPPSK